MPKILQLYVLVSLWPNFYLFGQDVWRFEKKSEEILRDDDIVLLLFDFNFDTETYFSSKLLMGEDKFKPSYTKYLIPSIVATALKKSKYKLPTESLVVLKLGEDGVVEKSHVYFGKKNEDGNVQFEFRRANGKEPLGVFYKISPRANHTGKGKAEGHWRQLSDNPLIIN